MNEYPFLCFVSLCFNLYTFNMMMEVSSFVPFYKEITWTAFYTTVYLSTTFVSTVSLVHNHECARVNYMFLTMNLIIWLTKTYQ